MTFKKWLHPNNGKEIQESTIFNLKIAIFCLCFSIVMIFIKLISG